MSVFLKKRNLGSLSSPQNQNENHYFAFVYLDFKKRFLKETDMLVRDKGERLGLN